MGAYPTRAFRLYLNLANAYADVFYLVDKEKFDDVQTSMADSCRIFRSYVNSPETGASFPSPISPRISRYS